MKKKLMFVAILMGLIMSFSTGLVACSGGGDTSDPPDKPGPVVPDDDDDGDDDDDQKENTVSKIAVKTVPDKTEYWVGETFSVDGGVITVTYRDRTTEDISMTDEAVEVGSVNMNIAALSKTVRVTYQNKSANFTIKIKEKGGLVTFDYNYDGAPASVQVQTEKDVAFGQDEAPTAERDGFTFDKWYTDESCTVEYAFDSPVAADATLYAGWKEDGATYYKATYDLNYYGAAVSGYTQLVKSGEPVRELAEFDIALNSDMYKMTLTNSAGEAQELEYAAVNLKKGGPVVAITINNVQLKEGSNLISLITDNTDNPTGVAGSGTYEGTAPMIDRIAVDTEAVVTWDGTKGLPKDNG